MNMKLIAAAVAAFGCVSASAVVLNPATAVVPASNYYYISGASAQYQAFNAIAKTLFDVPADVVKILAASPCPDTNNDSKHVSYLGVRNGVNTLITYRNSGGSGSGLLQLLAKNTAAPQIVSSGNVMGLPGSAAVAVNGNWTATSATCALKLPVVSLADVRPVEHTSAVTGLAGTASYDALSVIKPAIKTGLQGFGVAVSAPLYAALVAANNAAGIPLVHGTQPSIRKADYASLVNSTGTIKTAADLLNDPSDGNTIEIARRVATSGTQASSELYFLGAKTAGEQTPATATDYPIADIAANGIGVTEGSSTGDAKTRLNSATSYVIGVISLENVPAGTDTYKFVAIDGTSPNLAFDQTTSTISADQYQRQAVASGSYDFAYESYVLYKDAALNAAGTTIPKTGLAKALSDEIKKTGNSNLVGFSYLDLPGTWAPWTSGAGYSGNQNKQSRVSRSGNNLNPLMY